MKREPRLARAFQNETVTPTHKPVQDVRLARRKTKLSVLDGTHPLQEMLPGICVMYPVRELNEGKVTFFNFELAKEMGLIPADHAHEMTKELEAELIKTFSIRIINEYDQSKGTRFTGVKPNMYMATRYLQLQHENKLGRTSGDGRSIWNGSITHEGVTWDVSSRGTGVTCLAPGAVEAGKPLRSGATEFGYGCGMAEIDELYGTSIMSEIFHHQNIPTERMLCIIDIGKNLGIGVRAHKNLMRPAHLFALLKQSDYKNLRRAVDYVIDRQVKNSDWKIPKEGQRRYQAFLEQISKSFAKLAARLEADYIFVWLDWDGDNILVDGSIIDYGSVRQFGLKHDQYRYEDVDRFSTNLTGQKAKARQIVQIFAQMSDYLRTGRRKKISEYAADPSLEMFDKLFAQYRDDRFCELMGLKESDRKRLMGRYKNLFGQFRSLFHYFETSKISGEVEKLPDGTNKPALFNMRTFSREMPKLLLENDMAPVPAEIVFELILAENAPKRDRVMTEQQAKKLLDLQILYIEVVERLRGRRALNRFMNDIYVRAKSINRKDRLTGNGITVVVDELVSSIKNGLKPKDIQAAVEAVVLSQVHQKTPEAKRSTKKLVMVMMDVLANHSEDI